MDWFRFYDEALDDPKVQRLPGDLFKAWVNMLSLANRGRVRGELPDVPDIAFALRIDEPTAQAYVNVLLEKELLEYNPQGVLVPHGWSKRQFQSDDAAARQRVHRQRQNTLPDAESVTEQEPEPVLSREPSLNGSTPDPVTSNVTRNVTPIRASHVTSHVTANVTSHKPVAYQNRTDTESDTESESDQNGNITETEQSESARRDLTPRARAPAREEVMTNDDAAIGGDEADPELRWWANMVQRRAEREGLPADRLFALVDVANETDQWQARESPGVWRNWMLRALNFAVRDLRAATEGAVHAERTAQRVGETSKRAVGLRGDRAAAGPAARAPDPPNGQAAGAPSGPVGAAAVLAAFGDPDSAVSRAIRRGAETHRLRDVQRDGADQPPE